MEILYTQNFFSIVFSSLNLPRHSSVQKGFYLHRIDNVRSLFIYMPMKWHITPPAHRNSRHSGRFTDGISNEWFNTWEVLRQMSSLRNLLVRLFYPGYQRSDPKPIVDSWKSKEVRLFEPVRSVLAPTSFVIILPDKSCSTSLDVGASKCVFRFPE